MSWTNLPTDFTNAEYEGLRKYRMIDNNDGTISLEDQTEYTSYENSFYRAEDTNKAFGAINTLMNSSQEIIDVSICFGRLSYSSSNPIPDYDIKTADTLYFLPYMGNKIAVYKDNLWKIRTFNRLSLSLSGMLSGIPYDVFISENDNEELELSTTIWSNSSVRETNSLTWLDGVKVDYTDNEKRYLGTIVLNDEGYGEDSITGRLLWNQYNQESRPILSKLVTVKSSGTAHMGVWAPYYDEDAPFVKLLIPSREVDFRLDGAGLSSEISESDRAYGRCSALGILQDPSISSPFNNNRSCVDVFTINQGNSPLSVSLYNTKSDFIGFHKYYLGFWSNYSFPPRGTTYSNSTGETPGLIGMIKG